MPITTPTPSTAIASAIAERLPGFTYTQGADFIIRDAPRLGQPGIYEARNGELALSTEGTTHEQRSFLADIFQGQFRRYTGQHALYFTTQCPTLHIPSYLATSSAVEHKATSKPSLADIPRLTRLAGIVPILSQGKPFATVESSILQAMAGWCKLGFNWVAWIESDEATRLRDPDGLDQATPAQLEKLLTAMIRSDRFADGTIEDAYSSGLIRRIAQRAAAIVQQS
ncbi:uncharacterized protein N7496_007698 [Penicillium cataractarum]|uniref:Uncharacterized protein n=1 Tax=Penicillium cataractarum TaxID=2100454 RepID=A0A9W9RWZ8_9EURO|nr:uncharacterized protein N7496_007698 [Penicillium cataractarum]KAJ5367938.1 hypothetical protein N7496_007698 [Penicillium cataractarum]